MQTARIPPVDPAPATTAAAFAMHTGHIGPSFELLTKTSIAPQLGTYLYLRHAGADVLAVSFGPTAHPAEWHYDRPSQLRQRILEGPGPRSCRAPGDQSRGFQIPQRSSKHAPGNVSNVAAQLPVPVRPFFQREKDLRRPSADKDRVAASLRSRYNLVFAAHEINLTPDIETMGVTSVAGFEGHRRAGATAGSTWTR
jgi:hypothetical protein